MIVCRRWLPIWSATTSPLSQRRFRPRRRLRCRRKQGPIQFLENNPTQSSSLGALHVPQDKEKLASPSNCKIPSGSSCPQQPP